MAGPLLTPDEVGAALGIPVTVRSGTGQAGRTPIDVTEFAGPDGSVVLTVMRSGGMIARLAMRGNQGQSQPLAGVGDEARGGADWVTARRGEVVLLLRFGATARATPSATLVGLARAAVDRLPVTVTPGG